MEQNKYILGLDPGVGSVGWACMLADENNEPYRILDLGSRIFEPQGESMEDRRVARGTRRVLRRRKARVTRTRNLFVRYGYLSKEEAWKNHDEIKDPYTLRLKGKKELLTMIELESVLVHYSKGRGFKSNRKIQDKENASNKNEEGKLLRAKTNTENKLKEMQIENESATLTDLLIDSFKTNGKIRNTSGNYQNGITRKMVEEEVSIILNKQVELNLVSSEFADEYKEILFFQRSFSAGPDEPSPYHDPLNKMIGACSFEKGEKRAPKAAYSYELFTLVQKLTNIRYMIGSDYKNKKSLTAEQIRSLVCLAESGKKITYKSVRSAIDLKNVQDIKFIGLSLQKKDYFEILDKCKEDPLLDKEEEVKKKKDSIVISELKKTNELRKSLKKILKEECELTAYELDTIAVGLTSYKSDEELQRYLQKTDLEPVIQEAVMELSDSGYKEYGKVSLKFLYNILPLMIEEGLDYYSAAKEKGYDTAKRIQNDQDFDEVPVIDTILEKLEKSITNKAVIRTLTETRKVVNAVIRRYGKPISIHVEMARELTKSEDERKELQEQILSNQIARNSIKEQIFSKFSDRFDSPSKIRGDDILQYKLFIEQNGACPYTLLATGDYQKAKIHENELFTSDVEVDHIIPYSLCHDDRMINKVLVRKETNQNKSNQTPLEHYKGSVGENAYRTYLYGNKRIDVDKRERLLASRVDERFITDYRARTINDTRYAAKALKEILSYSFPNIKIISFTGQITAKLRGVWGLNGLTSSYENPKDYKKKVIVNDEIVEKELLLAKMLEEGYTKRSKDYQKIEKEIRSLQKKDEVKNRENHLHHAVDAAVLACATEKMRRRIEMHEMMLRQKKNEIIHFELPIVNDETGEVMEVKKFDMTFDQYFAEYGNGNVFEKYKFPQPYYEFSRELTYRAYEMNPDVLRTKLNYFPQYHNIDLNSITPLFVSHHYSSKLSGRMHKATFYGLKESGESKFLTERVSINNESFDEKKLEKIYDKLGTQNYIYLTVKEWLGTNKNGAEAYKNHNGQYPFNKNGNPIKKVKLDAGEVKEEFSIKKEANQYVAKEDVVQVHVYQRENDDKLYFVGMDRFRVLNSGKRDDLALVLWYGQGTKRITLKQNKLKENGFIKSPLILLKGQTVVCTKTDNSKCICTIIGCGSGLLEVESILGDGNDLINSGLFIDYRKQYQLTVSTIKSIKPVSVDVLGKIHSNV